MPSDDNPAEQHLALHRSMTGVPVEAPKADNAPSTPSTPSTHRRHRRHRPR